MHANIKNKRRTRNMRVAIQCLTAAKLTAALTSLLALDYVWFSLFARYVYPQLPKIRLEYGIIAWVALAVAVAAACPTSCANAASWGSAVGLVCYAVFNGTESAIRHDWQLSTAITDTVWGVFNCTCASLAAYVASA